MYEVCFCAFSFSFSVSCIVPISLALTFSPPLINLPFGVMNISVCLNVFGLENMLHGKKSLIFRCCFLINTTRSEQCQSGAIAASSWGSACWVFYLGKWVWVLLSESHGVCHVHVEVKSSFRMKTQRGSTPCTHTAFFTVVSITLVFGALHSITPATIQPGFALLLCTRPWKPSGNKPAQWACFSAWLVVSVFRRVDSCFAWWFVVFTLLCLNWK